MTRFAPPAMLFVPVRLHESLLKQTLVANPTRERVG